MLPSDSEAKPTCAHLPRINCELGAERAPSPVSPTPRLWTSTIMDGNPLSMNLESRPPHDSPISSADSHFGPLSPGTTDRVFPVRSVVSVSQTPNPYVRPEGPGVGFPGVAPHGEPSSISKRTPDRRSSNASVASISQASDVSHVDTPSRSYVIGVAAKEDEGKASDHRVGDEEKRLGSTRSSSVKGGSEHMNGSRQMQFYSDNDSIRSNVTRVSTTRSIPLSSRSDGKSDGGESGGLVTARFKHVVIDGDHAVITGRDGETLQRCEDEPIHIPGAVQGFGLLIALSEERDGKLVVRVVSENSKSIIGYTPKQLFALESFSDILTEEQNDNLLDHLDFIRDDDTNKAVNGPEVFTLSIRSPLRRNQKLWCAMHINDNNPELVICEFELEDDQNNPLVPVDEPVPKAPENTLNSNPTEEEYADSTVNSSKPLRVLRGARRRRGEAAAMEVFNIMSQVQEQLATAPNLEKFLKTLVGVVKELTGFHRVMVYQFDQAWNGRVVTELVDPKATKDLYRGLHFPASDIPRQARDLYKINKVRLLYDRDQETARLVCRTVEDLEKPLDLTYTYLRAMSPIHLKYLGNMGVRSSMSISLNAFDELWGLVACHGYGNKGMRVSFPIRKMCRLVGDSASRNIERLSYASRLQARKLINTESSKHNPSGYIIASSDDLLALFDADYGLLSIRDETKILGELEQTQEALAMLEYLRLRKITSVVSSQDILLDFPDLRYSPGFTVIAGILLVPLSVGGSDFIVFFRKGQMREVKWAGNPYEKFVHEGTEGYLEPRKSFKTWSEVVVGTSREWTEEQVETAAVLCLVYGKFIEVWRQKEAALQKSQFTKLLLANSAHEVRTPLNAIINYLEIAMEGNLDSETRENLSKSHSASKSLIYVINDLLDLTKTEEGKDLIKHDIFDLPATIREATDMFAGDAKRKQILYEMVENPGVPQFVIGDQKRVRQAICNITANAIQNTSAGAVKVELWLVEAKEGHAEIDIVVQDTGTGMSSSKLDALFRDLEQVQSESDEMLQEKFTPNAKALASEKETQRTLGLGLAVVARIVRVMNGQLRLKSEEGKGSRFVIQLGFGLPGRDSSQGLLEAADLTSVAPPVEQPTTPPITEGEVMLIPNSAQSALGRGARELVRRNSGESMNSIKSGKSHHSMRSFRSGSSGKSDVDRLIDAIHQPHMVENLLVLSASKASREESSSLGRRGSTRSQNPPASEPMELMDPSSVSKPGTASVAGQRTPIRPVRMSGDTPNKKVRENTARNASKVLFEIRDNKARESVGMPTAENMHVLVAEDDPINSKIIKKRLEKIGHEVYLTINGEECASVYGERAALFDVILMDMQMPIVDGLTSTKMIRSHEKSHTAEILSHRAALNGRIPIFAVSASLVEKDCQNYIDAGFDGWILKPVDFKRLSVLLTGIVMDGVRQNCLYKPGEWERGGWFAKAEPDVFSSMTKPSQEAEVSGPRPKSSHRGGEPRSDPISIEQDRLRNLQTSAVRDSSPLQDVGHSGDIEHSVL